jgi:DUF218 domain
LSTSSPLCAALKAHIADLQSLVACCVEWGENATNTLQNAQDTKCWVERREVVGPLLLITSRLHMARAIAALSAALPGRVLIAYPSKMRSRQDTACGCGRSNISNTSTPLSPFACRRFSARSGLTGMICAIVDNGRPPPTGGASWLAGLSGPAAAARTPPCFGEQPLREADADPLDLRVEVVASLGPKFLSEGGWSRSRR